MKNMAIILFIILIGCAESFAFDAPNSPHEKTIPPAEIPMPPPPEAVGNLFGIETSNQDNAQSYQINSDALRGLLRAQTRAIKSLSEKLDSLEGRVKKLENGGGH